MRHWESKKWGEHWWFNDPQTFLSKPMCLHNDNISKSVHQIFQLGAIMPSLQPCINIPPLLPAAGRRTFACWPWDNFRTVFEFEHWAEYSMVPWLPQSQSITNCCPSPHSTWCVYNHTKQLASRSRNCILAASYNAVQGPKVPHNFRC